MPQTSPMNWIILTMCTISLPIMMSNSMMNNTKLMKKKELNKIIIINKKWMW